MELGDFLRTMRARLRPESVGVTSYGYRRVPGLRREELARLAGVSVDYYTRLEQGRSKNASPVMLETSARALRINEAQRDHLFDLAGPVLDHDHTYAPVVQTVNPSTHELL